MEYALPLNLTWAFAHWPSLILIGIPLSLIANQNAAQIKRFRIVCLALFLLLLYGVLEKVPFALFPAVDAITALLFSLIIVPPTFKENPKLTVVVIFLLSIIGLSSLYYAYDKFQHRTPVIKETELMDGLFNLKTIHVSNSYKKELLFNVELTQHMPQETVCDIATVMAETLFETYHFDKTYKKIVKVDFNPKQSENSSTPYSLGEVSQHKETREHEKYLTYCYLN